MNTAVALVLVALIVDLWVRAHASRRPGTARSIAGTVGLATCAAAISQPLDDAAQRWFSVHMAQHLLLLEVVPVLIVAGQGWRWWPSLHRLLRGPSRRALRLTARLHQRRWTTPVLTVGFAGDVWLWHLPFLYDLTLREPVIHDVEHATFLTVGLAFFATMLSRTRRGFSPPQRIGFLAIVIASMLGLGALLASAQHPWYQPYASHLRSMRASLVDQHLGGAVMIFGGMVPLLIVFDVLLYRSLNSSAARRPRGGPAPVESSERASSQPGTARTSTPIAKNPQS